GEEVITAEYEQLFLHDIPMHGYIYAKHGGQWGVIDQQGREVKPFIYDEIGVHRSFFEDHIVADSGGYIGYLNKDFEWVIPPKEGRHFPGHFSDGMIPFRESGLSGYLNVKGEVAISPQFYEAGSFGDGFAPVKILQNDKVWQFIDTKGNKVKEIEAYSVGRFQGGFAIVEFYDETEAYVNKDFEIVLKGKFWLDYFNNDYAIIKTKDDQYLHGMVDTNGKILIEPKYENLNYRDKYDVLIYWEDGLQGLMTPDGEIIFPAEAKDIDWTLEWYDNLVLTDTQDGKEGYIDLNGKKYYED
ncbi:MAG: WG repeat-containing protein, partial [Cyclobacteriaceae bacterium]